MKSTGIVRRIDELGRLVIPKEIRHTMRMRKGEPMEIYTGNDGEVIFRKYSPLAELEAFASPYAEALHDTCGYPVVVCDRDRVIAAAGIPKKEILERRVSGTLEDLMEQRADFGPGDDSKIRPVEGLDRFAVAGATIMSSGEVFGAIMFMENPDFAAGEAEMKLLATAAAFLGKQM